MAPVWKLCRDAAKGQRAIRAARDAYLPKLSGQTDTAYTAYLNRASWFPATGRTVEGMLGLVFRKDPVLTDSEALLPWLTDITLSGIDLVAMARKATEDVITVGRYGLLVDYPPAPETAPGAALTKAEAELAGLRPYITPYEAEAILNWEHTRINNRTVLSRVCLAESYLDLDGKPAIQIRELTIESGSYLQIVWRKTDKGWDVHETIIPTKGNLAMTDIPFVFMGPEETTGDVSDPPIEGLAEVNISHFCNSADLENGAHISGLPTPIITGIDQMTDEAGNPMEVHLGSSTAILLPSGAEAMFLQVGSEGFASIENLMNRKEDQMAVLGARIIAPEKAAAETAQTTQTKKGSESSVLGDIARSVSNSITKALTIVGAWGGIAGEIKFELNRDYLMLRLTAPDITAIVAAWQGGAISDRTKFNAFKAGELIEEKVTFEDEQEEIESSGPPLGDLTDDPADPNANGE